MILVHSRGFRCVDFNVFVSPEIHSRGPESFRAVGSELSPMCLDAQESTKSKEFFYEQETGKNSNRKKIVGLMAASLERIEQKRPSTCRFKRKGKTSSHLGQWSPKESTLVATLLSRKCS